MPKSMFCVSPKGPNWRGHRYHYVMAGDDPVDAARKTFLELKDVYPKKFGRGVPESYEVWRVMTPDEYEENIGGCIRFDDEQDEDTKVPYHEFEDLLIDKRVVRL